MSAVPVDPADGPAVEVRPTTTAPTATVIDGVRAVVWTGADGAVHAARDVCPHRRAPLSAGSVVDGELQCRYHGWTYDGTGRCTLVPAIGADGHIPPKAQLELLEVPDDLVAPPAVGDGQPEAQAVDGGRWIDGDTAELERFWHPVARRGEVPPEGTPSIGVELLGAWWRVERDGAGQWSAVSSQGQRAWAVQTHLDHIWLAPDEPAAPLPSAPEWGADGWHHRRMNRVEGRFGVGLLLDNQLDAGHFPFVHTTTFGTPAAATLPPTEVTRAGTTVRCDMRVPIAATNDPLALAGEHRLEQQRTMRYEYHAPLWLRLRLDYEDMGGSTVILFSLTPLGRGRCRMDIDLLFQHPDGFTEAQLDDRVAFEERVVAEDLRLQRLFEDVRLPLEPNAEVHTKADRLSVQCRQVLRELLSLAH